MIRRNPRGDWPEISEGAFVDPTAIICGRCRLPPGFHVPSTGTTAVPVAYSQLVHNWGPKNFI